jgi:signal peptidase I
MEGVPGTPFGSAVRHRWRSLGDWSRALVAAFGLLLLLHLFVVRWAVVENTSMYATLRPGDLVMVQRWAKWTGVDRGDIVLFRDPLKDRTPLWRRPLMVKRIAGMPGDTVELRNGVLTINGQRQDAAPGQTRSHLVRLRSGASPAGVLQFLGLEGMEIMEGRSFIELPLNDSLAEELEQRPDVVSVSPMGPATGAPGHIFPFSPRFRWNGDDYGPLVVPAKGDTVTITIDNLPLFDRIISRYEGHRLVANGNVLMLDDVPLEHYVIEQDYFFVLGDSRHHSADSRYWGFVPRDHMVGRTDLVITGHGGDGERSGPRMLE